MPYPQVLVGSIAYDSYVDLADADTYLAAQITATDWAAATSDQRGAALVSMTRTLDRQLWLGAQENVDQGHAFPRTGLFYSDGITPVDPTSIPAAVAEATAEGASQLLSGVPIQDEANTFNFDKILKAGSVMIEKFRQVDDNQPRFPQVVQELIGRWLAGAQAAIPQGSKATGTHGKSIMEEQYDVNRAF